MDSATQILQSVFGHSDFRPSQRAVVEDVLAGHDTLCVMPTGAGKSLCFQLPAVRLGGLAVIVSPLISLMADQHRHMAALKVPVILINSSQSKDDYIQTMRTLRAGFKGLLYVAPERFASESFTSLIAQLKPKMFVVDEAHCISSWGHDFRPDYMRLAGVRKRLGSPLTVALTATATPAVRDDIVKLLGLSAPRIHVTGFDRPNLRYACRRFSESKQKDSALIQYLREHSGSGIVYCSTRRAVEELTALLEEKLHERPVFAYHAGMDPAARNSSQTRFMKFANSIAIATNAFGMGINKPDIRFVLHYNTPGSIEAYYQEAGRAGRDGLPSDCTLFYCAADRRTQEFFINKLGDNNPSLDPRQLIKLKEHAEQKLERMMRYAAQAACRRKAILEYFGDRSGIEDCNCDNCAPRISTPRLHQEPASKPQPRESLRPPVARNISSHEPAFLIPALTAVMQMDGAYGITTVADVLSGSKAKRLESNGLNCIPAYGKLSAFRSQDIAEALREMVEDGLLVKKAVEGYFNRPVISLSAKGIALLGNLKSGALISNAVAQVQPPAAASEGAIAEDANSRYERLRLWRRRVADDKRLPAFCILHDSVLQEIARTAPTNLMDLAHVKGLGSAKLQSYGDEILRVIAGTHKRELKS